MRVKFSIIIHKNYKFALGYLCTDIIAFSVPEIYPTLLHVHFREFLLHDSDRIVGRTIVYNYYLDGRACLIQKG